MTHGPLMIDLQGTALTDQDIARLKHPLVGGVILFDRNFESPQQLRELTAEIKSLSQPALQISVDQEGGRVQRLTTGFTRLPPLRAFGHAFDDDPALACHLARYAGWLMATEIRSVGIDFSLAPVLDLDWGLSEVIGHRAFHRDVDAVAQLARAYIDGIHAAGMVCVGKHFPGHGGVLADTHFDCVTDERPEQTLTQYDMRPFFQLTSANLLDGVMTAHIRYPAIDANIATFSPKWIKDKLRTQLGFRGLVLSDDLSMAGTGEESIVSRTNTALSAGCDIALVCNDPAAVDELLSDPNALVRRQSSWFNAMQPTMRYRPSAGLRDELAALQKSWRDNLGSNTRSLR